MTFFRAVVASLPLLALSAPAPAEPPYPHAVLSTSQGLVVSSETHASEAGAEILRRGGNAVDAAVATGLALAVTYPWAGNLGGGGFMLIHLAGGRDVALDFRETAPAAATRTMYLGPDGGVLTGDDSSTAGWRASGVPGTVAGFALALEKYGSGRVTWAEVVEPARRLAAEGHRLSAAAARRLQDHREFLGRCAETKRVYLGDGEAPRPGELRVLPDLAATLARLQRDGPREFYEGETARRIAADMAAHHGTLTLDDLRGYRPVERVPVRGTYRGFEVVAMPPPSSGGIGLLQMLGMLEPFAVAAHGRDSAENVHLFVEVMRRAYRDRAVFLGDPDFVALPVAGLLDRTYLAGRMRGFDPQRATPSADLAAGRPADAAPAATALPRRESTETTHYSIVDAAGNAAAVTYTLNGGYGSGVTIAGTGVLLNNEMDDFTAKPGAPNAYGLLQGEANAIAPGKRPLSSMTPTFVFGPDRRLLLVTGSPGGATIITTVLEVVTNVIDHRLPVGEAVAAPRFHHQWMPDVIHYEPDGLAPAVLEDLRIRGHTLAIHAIYQDAADPARRDRYLQGDAETIWIDPVSHLRLGAADPRQPDARAVAQ